MDTQVLMNTDNVTMMVLENPQNDLLWELNAKCFSS